MRADKLAEFKKKAAQAWGLEALGLSERKACRTAKVNRKTYRKYKEELFGDGAAKCK